MKDLSLVVEGLLTKLEKNRRLLESLEAESPAKSEAGAPNQSDKRGTIQSVANPAIQQPTKCTSCGMDSNVTPWSMISRNVRRKKARLQNEANKRGERES